MDSDLNQAEIGEGKPPSGNNSFSTSPINLPKGGGAIRGMGEKFAANPVTGTGSMTVPIATSPGRSGFGPQLALAYDSGAGNGIFGFGWNLSLPAITRKTDKGLPQYLDAVESDEFLLPGAEDLVPVLKQDGHRFEDSSTVPEYTIHRYRPRIEGQFARIERWTRKSDNAVHWRSISRDNILTIYGKDINSRIADSKDPLRIFSWLICETRDDKGNAVLYEYKHEDGVGADLPRVHERNRGGRNDPRRTTNRYLKHIRYGNRLSLLDNSGKRPLFLNDAQINNAQWLFQVVFDYGEHDADIPTPNDPGQWDYRNDAFSTYRPGFEVRTTRLCQRVLMFHHFPGEEGVGNDCLVRSTDFTYSHEQAPKNARNPVYTFLHAVSQTGYKRDDAGYLKRSLPPVEFEYTQPLVQDTVEEVDTVSLENLPSGIDGAAYQWTDLHGEGIPGILTEQADAWFYKRNLSPISDGTVELTPLEHVACKPNLAIAAGAQFMDLAGDGQPDLVVMEGPMPGLYEHDGKQGWQPFRPFTSRLNRKTRDPNLKFIDLDGDGHADILISEDNAFVWHRSLEEGGFGQERRVAQALDEEKGPRLLFADGTQSIYLADFSGDGLTDLVRMRNGEVCYWPNLGYGHFGAKVTMDHAPYFDHPDQFSHRRIRLADIDGTGTTDIIYLHSEGVRLYFNQSGNSWSEAQVLKVFPHVDFLVSITAADLLGNGTACLVWSSPLPGDATRAMRYVNLMGGHKPHLLVKTVNNLGAETRIHYAPSTKFYLQDKQDGKPWITRLPFPVHVVEGVETYDHISRNRFVSRYAYHHGYFDDVEREFRGFGMVEQWDTEEYAALSQSQDYPAGNNIDASSHVPPVLTKTWFHTGAYLGRNHISNFFAGLLNANDTGEYYREPGKTDAQARALLLEDTILPDGLTVDEEREACRALKGSMLRQEVYALDGTDKEPHPYTVTEQNFTIRHLQPMGDNLHGVFFIHTREVINSHYERNPTDPRIAHTMTLEVDAFGNVLKEAAIGYGRRQPDMNLSVEDRAKQAQTLVTYTQNRVTNAIGIDNNYRTPLPCESRTYELTGYLPTAAANRFQISNFVQPDPTDANGLKRIHTFDGEVNYEDAPPSGRQRRLIEHLRTLYRPDDFGESQNDPLALLPLGTIEPQSLPGETYKLVFTPGLLAQVYQRSRNGQPPENLLLNPNAILPVDIAAGKNTDRGGYVDLDSDGHWWIPTGRVFHSPNIGDTAVQERSYARQHFILPLRSRDPFGQTSTVANDAYDLLMTEAIDALGNQVTAANDYRVLQPTLMTDPNRNRTQIAFDALGMVVGTAVMGKSTEDLGDSLAGFEEDLSDDQVSDFYNAADPHLPAQNLLKDATTRIIYDLHRFHHSQQANLNDPERWQAPFATILSRETHDSELPAGQTTKIQISFSYSDGFGREIQKKLQAEPGPVPKRDAEGKIIVGQDGQPEMTENGVNPRWVGSGWTVFNNKGKPVRQFEPFFTDHHTFEFNVRIGVSPILFYDPAERVVATLHPNHTWEKLIFDPWRQESWDVSDTVLVTDPSNDNDVGEFFFRLPDADYLPTWYAQRQGGMLGPQEQTAARKAAIHADTPIVVHFDSLGRTFLTLAHNRFKHSDMPPADPPIEEFYETRNIHDIEGNLREVIDANGRIVMRYAYHMAGPEENEDDGGTPNRIHQMSMEAGESWMLHDVLGNPIRSWDNRGHNFITEYDTLRRPIKNWVHGTDPNSSDPRTLNQDVLFEKTDYGEGILNDAMLNMRTRVFKQSDGAGVITIKEYDFKGNLRHSSRELVQDYKGIPNWSGNVPMQTTDFSSHSTYDALNRPQTLTSPDGSILRPSYNEANLLEKVVANLQGAVTAIPLVNNIDYDAKGQRELIEYSVTGDTGIPKLVRTTYDYDPLTFRLTKLRTTRTTDGAVLQNLFYTYDPVGNIMHIRDDAQQTIYFNGQVVEPNNTYIYDAIYRLIEATGREHHGNAGRPWTTYNDSNRVNHSHPNDGQAMRNYTEHYEYDRVGNFKRLMHGANNGQVSWQRLYDYEALSLIPEDSALNLMSNRLTKTTINGQGLASIPESYAYNAHGNMTKMPQLKAMQWDFKDQLFMAQRQAVNAQDEEGQQRQGERTYYVYDASGQRVRKVTELANGNPKDERIYLSMFEIYRKHSGTSSGLVRETLHIMDDKQRIALVETRNEVNDNTPQQLIRYQFSNHIDSSSLELDYQGRIISYEEYSPYGSTLYQAIRSQTETPKRYRYTGKERDDESGLYYHGARYYAPWLGRWLSCDPEGLVDGPNSYSYALLNPIRNYDPHGTQTQPSNFVQAVSSLEEGFQFLKNAVGKGSSGEFALVKSQATGDLMIIEGSGSSLSVPKGYAPLGHSHVPGVDPTPGPSTADFNILKGRSVRSHWIFAKKGAAHLEYDPISNSFRETTYHSSGKITQQVHSYNPKGPYVKAGLKYYPGKERSVGTFRNLTTKTIARLHRTSQIVGKGVKAGFGALGIIGSALEGFHIGTGLVDISEGRVAEGSNKVAFGTARLGTTLGGAKLVQTGKIAAGGGGGSLFLAGMAAVGSLILAETEISRTLRGEKTAAAEATDYWKEVQDRSVSKEATVGGAFKYVGAEFAKGLSGFISSGQKNLWGLL